MKNMQGKVKACCLLVLVIMFVSGTSVGRAEAAEFAGKIVAVKGKVINVSFNRAGKTGAPRVGDEVKVSYTIGDDIFHVGTWQVNRIVDNETLEADLKKAEAEPNIGMDAVVHATGTKQTAKKDGESEKSVDGSFTGTADERFDLALKLYEGKDIQQDKNKAVALLKQGVEEGHPASMRAYGWLYEKGEAGFVQDYKEALMWYRKAAQAGDSNAFWLMGLMYADGRGVARDVPRAVELYEQACNKGMNSGCYNLAWQHYTGTGLPKDLSTARKWYEKSCGMNHAEGCGTLGWMHYNGEGITADKTLGLELLQKSCSMGSKWGCDRLAEIK